MSDEPVRVSISSQTGVHPEEISRRSFPTARRGLDPDAVRRYLETLAAQLQEVLDREQALRRRLAEAERQAADPQLDEATLLRAVGAETARILEAAHDAAADVVSKAEARAAEILAEAENVMSDRVAAAEAEAEALREAATAEAAAVAEAAQAEAVALLDTTRAECRRIVREARRLRGGVLRDLADKRRSLRIQLEQLRAGRDALIGVVDAVGDSVDDLRERLASAEHDARLAAAEAGELAEEAEDESDLFDGDAEIAVDLGEPAEDEELLDGVGGLDEGTGEGFEEEARVASELEEAALVDDGVHDAPMEPMADELSPEEEQPEVPPVGAATTTEHEDGEEAPVIRILRREEVDLLADEGLAGELDGDSEELRHDHEAEREAAVEAVEESVQPSHRSVDELFARIRASRQDETPGEIEQPGGAEAPVEGVLGQHSAHEAAVAEVDEDVLADEEPGADGGPSPEGDQDARTEEAFSEFAGAGEVDAGALGRRAALLDPIAAKLSRSLKRALQDDQNVLLDALRHTTGRPELHALLPEEQQRTRLGDAVSASLSSAWAAGHAWLGGGEAKPDDANSAGLRLAAELAEEVTGLLRHRLDEALAPISEVEDGAGEAAGAAYREWRGSRVEGVAGDFATRAFSDGAVSGGVGVLVRWVVDDGGRPCPDCDDNSLAGPVEAGEEFPTGQPHPPVHPGCRCLLVPISS